MGWQDAPLVDENVGKRPAWMDAPLVDEQSAQPAIDTSKGRAAYMSQFPKDEESQKKAQFDYETQDRKESVPFNTNFGGGLARGAGSIGRTLLTASKLASYPGNKIASMLKGDKEYGVDQILAEDAAKRQGIDEGLTSLIGSDPNSGAYKTGKVASEIAGTAGIPVPFAQGAKGFIPRTGQALKNTGIGAVAGGGQGFVSEGQQGVIPGAVAGGAFSGGLEVAKPVVGGSIGKIIDMLAGKTTDIRAGKIGRDVAGDKLDEIKALLAKSPDDVNAIQAAAGADSTRFSALGKRGEKVLSEAANKLEGTQESGREATLNAVKPYLPAAEKARSAVTAPLYDAADKATVKIDKEMFDILGRAPKGTIEKAAEIARMEGKPFVLDVGGNEKITGESAHYIKRALSDISYAPAQGVGKDTQKAAKKVLEDFTKKFEESVPVYKQARSEFRDMSKEVNQAKVIQAMQDTLKASKGGERVQPFLEAQGRGESALIKRADQSPRFGGIEDILSKEQLQAREKVVSELMRDAKVEDLAKKGSEDVAQVLARDAAKFRLPWTMSAKVAAMNKGLDVLESSLNQKTMNKVYQAMQTPKDTLKLLNTLPATERVKVINAMVKMNTTALAPAAGELAAQK